MASHDAQQKHQKTGPIQMELCLKVSSDMIQYIFFSLPEDPDISWFSHPRMSLMFRRCSACSACSALCPGLFVADRVWSRRMSFVIWSVAPWPRSGYSFKWLTKGKLLFGETLQLTPNETCGGNSETTKFTSVAISDLFIYLSISIYNIIYVYIYILSISILSSSINNQRPFGHFVCLNSPGHGTCTRIAPSGAIRCQDSPPLSGKAVNGSSCEGVPGHCFLE